MWLDLFTEKNKKLLLQTINYFKDENDIKIHTMAKRLELYNSFLENKWEYFKLLILFGFVEFSVDFSVKFRKARKFPNETLLKNLFVSYRNIRIRIYIYSIVICSPHYFPLIFFFTQATVILDFIPLSCAIVSNSLSHAFLPAKKTKNTHIKNS